jgi:hypothetical protein
MIVRSEGRKTYSECEYTKNKYLVSVRRRYLSVAEIPDRLLLSADHPSLPQSSSMGMLFGATATAGAAGFFACSSLPVNPYSTQEDGAIPTECRSVG